jgi:hypothetical protein
MSCFLRASVALPSCCTGAKAMANAHHHHPKLPARVLEIARACDAAVPCIPFDVHALIARLTAPLRTCTPIKKSASRRAPCSTVRLRSCRTGVDYAWDLCDCKERKQFEFANADASDPLVDPTVSTVANYMGDIVVSRLFVLAARETIGQSGLTRWAVRIEHNPEWALAFGVTQHAPAEVNQRLHRSGYDNPSPLLHGAGCAVTDSDDKTYSVATCSIGRFIHGQHFHRPSWGEIAKSPGLKSGAFRMGTVYFRADLVANILTIVMAPDADGAVGKGGSAQEWCRLTIYIPELASYYPHCALMAPSVRISFPDPEELRAPDEQ